MKSVSVALLPSLIQRESLADCTAVVIDVLRATSVIATALGNGAAGVIACESIDQAQRRAADLPGAYKLCGERGGLPIDGFDLGNSPAEYPREVIADKTVVMTTTNGTRALAAVDTAADVLTASFLNLSAASDYCAQSADVLLVCAGTDGQISGEDVLLAGAIAKRLIGGHGFETTDDSALLAIAAWEAAEPVASDPARLAEFLALSKGGRNLQRIGFADDLQRVARIDSVPLVPRRESRNPLWLRCQ